MLEDTRWREDWGYGGATSSTNEARPNFADPRLDLPPNFSGLDMDWDTWVLKFKAYCQLVGLGDPMEAAASSCLAIVMEALHEDAQTKPKIFVRLACLEV